ncbi:MAG: glutathione S-transferase family protein [Gammaproteobacteria bacterium]|nr:glutathione S-transferase family protein [Gammaproteobacteria bacterium]
MSGSGNCYKPQLLMSQLGMDFEWVELDLRAGASRTADFLAMNPNGKVPLLEIEPGTTLPESNAILWYLAEGTPFLPEDRLERARVLQWMFFEQYSHEPNIATVRFWIAFLGNPESHQQKIAECRPRGYAALDVMEGELARRSYFAGDRYSIADIALYAYTHVAHEGGFELDRYPAINDWLQRVREQPGHVPMATGDRA